MSIYRFGVTPSSQKASARDELTEALFEALTDAAPELLVDLEKALASYRDRMGRSLQRQTPLAKELFDTMESACRFVKEVNSETVEN